MAKKTRKFSEFVDGAAIINNDEVVGLRNGQNTIFDGNTSGSGGSGSVSAVITQANAFVFGDWVKHDGTNYIKSQANSTVNAESIGMVTNANATSFTLTMAGYIESGMDAATYGPLTAGGVYFISDTTSGEISLTEPSTIDFVSKPCFVATGTDKGWIIPYRGQVYGAGVGASSGGGSGTNVHTVTQVGHTFTVNNVVRVDGTDNYALAQANNFTNSQAVGIVIGVAGDDFTIQSGGFTNALSGLTANNLYYLDENTAGLLTTTKPVKYSSYDKPMFFSTNTGEGWILEQRPKRISETNSNVKIVSQIGHPFAVEDFVRTDGGSPAVPYVKAQADTLANSRAVGMVVDVLDANTFALQSQGYFDGFTTVLTPGTQYYLDDLAAGNLKPGGSEPALTGTVSKPLVSAITASSGWILEQRPMLQPNANGGAGGGGGGAGGTIIVSNPITPGATLDYIGVFSDDYDRYEIILVDLEFSTFNAVTIKYGVGGVFDGLGSYHWVGGGSRQPDGRYSAVTGNSIHFMLSPDFPGFYANETPATSNGILSFNRNLTPKISTFARYGSPTRFSGIGEDIISTYDTFSTWKPTVPSLPTDLRLSLRTAGTFVGGKIVIIGYNF